MSPSASSKSPGPNKARPSWKAPCSTWVSSLVWVWKGSSLPRRCAAGRHWPRVVRHGDAAPSHAGPEPAPGRCAAAPQRARPGHPFGQRRPAVAATVGRRFGAFGAHRSRPWPRRAPARGHRPAPVVPAWRRRPIRVRAGGPGIAGGHDMAVDRRMPRGRCRPPGPARVRRPGDGGDHGSSSSSIRRRWFMASRTRDLTVPRGMPRSLAIGHGAALQGVQDLCLFGRQPGEGLAHAALAAAARSCSSSAGAVSGSSVPSLSSPSMKTPDPGAGNGRPAGCARW